MYAQESKDWKTFLMYAQESKDWKTFLMYAQESKDWKTFLMYAQESKDWNNLPHVRSRVERLENQIIKKFLGARKSKGLNRLRSY